MTRRKNLAGILSVLLIFFTSFNAKKFLFSFSPHVNEYFSVFFYFTDIICVLLITLFFLEGGSLKRALDSTSGKALAFFLVLVFFSVGFASDAGLALYHAIRVFLYAMTTLSLSFFIQKGLVGFKTIFSTMSVSAVFQSIVGFFQFLKGSSVGLRLLGESVITPATKGVARVFIGGEPLLRAYGTLPHANILGAFLGIGLLCLFYLFLSEEGHGLKGFWSRVLSLTGIFIVFLGLITTFSRSGWIVAIITTLILLIYAFWKSQFRKNALSLLSVLLVYIGIIFMILGWAIVPRAGFIPGEPSVDNRVLYNAIGIELIKDHPLGVGVGNEVSQAVSQNLYQKKGFSTWWLWQPVHNLYILIASEIGVLGLITFLLFLFFLFFESRNIKNMAFFVFSLIAVSFLLFGLFDHFMWDLPAGELMMWISIGFLLSFKKRGS